MFFSARRTSIWLTILYLAAVRLQADEPQRPLIPVGAAKIDITPDFPVRLSGYGNRKSESQGIAQRLWAKAIVLGADGDPGPAVWIIYENCGLTSAIREAVAKRLQAKAGIQSERLVISVTHSHTAPCLTGWAPYIFGADVPPDHQAHIDQYTEQLIEKLGRVALDALAARHPANLFWAQGRVGFAVNRRVLKDGKWTGFGVQADGPVDHSLPVLVAKDASGKLIACIANYACHCTTLGGNFNQIAGDWAGFAQQFIESDQGSGVAMIAIGCGADANPHPRQDDLEVCRQHGRALADEVKRLMASQLRPVDPGLNCRMLRIQLPFDTPRTEQQWKERAQLSDATGYHARQFLARLQAGEKIPEVLPYPVAVWSFGRDLAMVFLGGEVVVDYGIRMKSEFDAERLWITAYSNDVPCYIPSRRILREGGYEADRSMAYYARPQQFAGEVEDLILDAVQKLLPHWFYSPAKQVDFPPPKSPEESLQAIKVLPGLKVELVAAEPLIEDPVAFDWGTDGRLWVAEMYDYPNGMAWDKPGDPMGVPGGRIKLLTDDNGDGRYDRATLFLDKIPFPNGVKAWRNGVLVTAAPTVFYAEDTNGDYVADKRETLFEGFTQGNQQHRANGLRWGFDNWLYMANGDSGGKIKSIKTGSEIAISGRDLRIRPDDGAVEAQSGQTQFGRCRDDWGNWFGGNNSNPLWHYVLDDYYLRRNPHFTPPAVRRDVPEVPGAAPVFPLSRTLARFNDFHTANRFTSACSPEIYRDEKLNSTLGTGTHVFVCEPVHNLVHREVMREEGVSFRSRRAAEEQQCEFFASADNWCRPVMVRTAPDGTIWVADMYRQVIEHPEWIPVSWQRKLDLRAGSDRGRIYRISVTGEKLAALPRLDQLDTDALVDLLDHPNGWQRDMAHQMLLWSDAQAAVPRLEQLAAKSLRPTGRLHALGTLAGLNALRSDVLQRGFSDKFPGVRRWAIRFSEPMLNDSWEVAAGIADLASDSDPLVRMQVAYSLGQWKDPTAGESLGQIAIHNSKDVYITAAVLSSVNESNISTLTTTIMAVSDPQPALVERLLGIAASFADKSIVNRIVAESVSRTSTSGVEERLGIVAGLLEALRRGKETPVTLLDTSTLTAIERVVAEARQLATDLRAGDSERLLAIRILGAQPAAQSDDSGILLAGLSPRSSPELQLATVAALTARFPNKAPSLLVSGWQWYSPALRAQILDTLSSRTTWTAEFLGAVERGEVPSAHIDARRRQQLVNHADGPIRARAVKLFGSETPTSRAQLVEQFQNVFNMSADMTRGKGVFAKKCAVCHRLEDAGQNVGPDLLALTDKSPRSMLVAILDPNKAVEDKFLDYVAITNDGRQFTGMIVNETSTSVTLAGQEGKQVTLRRNELDMLQSTGKSLMPEGLEKDLSGQDFADVLAYVRSISAPPKQFPGNKPEVAHVRDDGSIRLLAMNAKIYGPTLVFEDKYRNLGFWQRAEDHAVWMLNVPKAGKYRVAIDYACDDPSAGDRFVITVGDQTVGGVVESTGSWDSYRNRTVGSLKLPAGQAELIMRADGPIRSALIDVRQIVLHPE